MPTDLSAIKSSCPRCSVELAGPFPVTCPNCGFSIDGLTGKGTTDFQIKKWKKHTDLLQGRAIQLSSGVTYNASFDYNGVAKLDDIVRFAIAYGDRAVIPSPRGKYNNPIIIAYIPEQIGTGTAIHFPGTVPCSGICLISPHSHTYAHSFPVIDEWVDSEFKGYTTNCRICNKQTSFAQPVCLDCYSDFNSDWRNLI